MTPIEFLFKQAGFMDYTLGSLAGKLTNPFANTAFIQEAVLPTAAGAGIGALRHVIHGNEDRSMWDDVKSGMIAGGVIGGTRALHSLSGLGGLALSPERYLFSSRTPVIGALASYVTPTIQTTAAGVLADQLISDGKHPWLGALGGAAAGTYLTGRTIRELTRAGYQPSLDGPLVGAGDYLDGFMNQMGKPVNKAIDITDWSIFGDTPPVTPWKRIRLATGI